MLLSNCYYSKEYNSHLQKFKKIIENKLPF